MLPTDAGHFLCAGCESFSERPEPGRGFGHASARPQQEELIVIMGLFRTNLARKAAKADARVAALTERSTQLQLRRSQAQTAMAQAEVDRLRADLDALRARYAALKHHAEAKEIPNPRT